MKKRYLFLIMLLFPLATILTSNSVHAQTDAEYDAAMAAITDGTTYYIATDVDGVRCYLTSDGLLAYDKLDAGIFTFKKTAGGEFKTDGWFLDGGTGNYFSNPAASNSIGDTKINTHSISGCRTTWEAQVFFLNENGKFAVRATNAAPTTSTSGWNWVGQSFWAVNEGPTAGYSFDVNYIWELELPSDKNQIWTILNSVVVDYEQQVWDDEEGYSMNIGTGFGQRADVETWQKFWDLLQKVYQVAQKLVDEDYNIDTDPDAPTLEWANQVRVDADSMYQKILDSEIPYSLPNGDGYYRIISRLRYSSTASESGYVDKALAASISSDHANKGVYATVNRDLANFIWKLTQHGDSIEIQNAGVGTFISYSSPAENRVIMTDAENDRSHVTFDYAGLDYVETDDDEFEKDIFYIRLAGKPRGGSNYFHQLSHSGKTDNNTASGNSGTDSGTEMELSFWAATFDKGVDKGTSEWYLEYVPTEEAEKLIESFAIIHDHTVLVDKNNALRAKVLEDLLVAKDSVRTKLITDASQMSSPYSQNDLGNRDGGDISAGVLIDGDKTSYWHSAYQNTPPEPHFILLSGMEEMVGDCELYLCQRAADNDHPAEFTLYGSDNPDSPDEDWVTIAVMRIPHTGSGEENTISFNVGKAFPYVRVTATDCIGKSYGNRTFWHAAELQISTVRPNPNSQYVAMGEIAENLDRIYKENIAVADDDITVEMYEALLSAYRAFLGGMVDPTELRDALATYANLTKCVVEGTEPGQWINTDIAEAFDALYKEVQDYDEAGRYSAVQNHKYAVMLKAMSKSVMERANGIKTDKWYHITFPTEEMFDQYGFDKSGAGKSGLVEEQAYQWGNIVAVGKEVSEETPGVDDDGNEVTITNTHIEALESDEVREGSRLFFLAEDEISDQDVSLFRFVEREADATGNTELFSDVKNNMWMALDMSTTYKRGDALITDASQLSSNASDKSEGLHIENLIDGNPNTYWHSDYHQETLAPGYIQVALNEPVSGLIQVDMTRRQNATNGHVVRMYIQGSNDAENWTNVGYLETPFTNQNESVTSIPVNLNGSYSYLRFTLTNRYGTDGGGNMEFDPFAVVTSKDEYNKLWTYFHAAEFQIYPVTAEKELSASGQALQNAYTTANKVILKDATSEDLAAATQAYKAYQAEFNISVGKAVLPDGADKATPSYAIQNKATGLFINAKQSNSNDVFVKIVPTFFTYDAPGYQRSLLHGKNLDGTDCTYLHSGNSNHRLCSWNAYTAGSNSGLVIREVESVEPAEFTFYKDIKPGRIYAWCNAVTITPQADLEMAVTYTPLGQYSVEEEGVYLALKQIGTIEAGQPAFYIYGDTTAYSSEADDAEAIKFTMKAEPDFVYEGATVNGVIGSLVNHTLKEHEIYFSGNHAICIGSTGYYLSGPCVALGLDNCPKVDPDGDYDFSIFLGVAAEDAGGIIDGMMDVPTAIRKISMPGAVYSMDGKLLRTNATLNSLKSLGKGMYILNGVKVVVK